MYFINVFLLIKIHFFKLDNDIKNNNNRYRYMSNIYRYKYSQFNIQCKAILVLRIIKVQAPFLTVCTLHTNKRKVTFKEFEY